MATILVTWELGEGMGHLAGLVPIMQTLVERGHRVVAALKDLSEARVLFPDDRICLLPAPSRTRSNGNAVSLPMTYAHILHNVGFDLPAELDARSTAWRNLYDLVQPDVVMFEHSPTALLAARGASFRKIVAGTGFVVPPDATTLPNLRPWATVDAEILQHDEQRVLENMNQILGERGEKHLDYVAQLFAETDERMLITFRELDHYQQRTGAKYWGVTTDVKGTPPQWLAGDRQRVFGYLRQFAGVENVLQTLAASGHDVLLYSPGMDPQLKRRHSGNTLRFAEKPVDMKRVGAECDVAVLGGTHGASIAMLLAGAPVLQVPKHLEQTIVTLLVERLGAGCGSSRRDVSSIRSGLKKTISELSYRTAARKFASKYANFDARHQVEAMADLVESLL